MLGNYPSNWKESADAIKNAAGYQCQKCDLRCLPNSESYQHLDLAIRRKFIAQVHHIDRDPSNNDRSNLICLCSGCHLREHRHRPAPSPGQLALKVKVRSKTSRRQKIKTRQESFFDLIDRLPTLPKVEQLELKF
jgi:5-methylcytosine-specific restriction endonuclease McrA